MTEQNLESAISIQPASRPRFSFRALLSRHQPEQIPAVEATGHQEQVAGSIIALGHHIPHHLNAYELLGLPEEAHDDFDRAFSNELAQILQGHVREVYLGKVKIPQDVKLMKQLQAEFPQKSLSESSDSSMYYPDLTNAARTVWEEFLEQQIARRTYNYSFFESMVSSLKKDPVETLIDPTSDMLCTVGLRPLVSTGRLKRRAEELEKSLKQHQDLMAAV